MEPIIEEFTKILTTESEENIRRWIVDNFDKFPEDWQSLILGAFFEESLDLASRDLDERINYFSELLNTYKDLSSVKKRLEDKLRELQIKEEIEGLNN
ncbi:MAG: hypothetical protein KatS3mg095_0452 [Candidatus Parcubacteria bacterium]|nr:MAG: hypothetical protein KatS3mg095_0452 [Candidatus Parcubacteria bacterium]